MTIDHVERARKAWPILVRRAKSGKGPLSYGELCAEMNLHHRAAQWFLGVIQTYCKKNRLPALQALAVNKQTRLPGKGYAGSVRSRKKHAEEVKRVENYKWKDRAPKFRT